MDDMLNRKVCRLLSNEEVKTYTGPKYYIAHHKVIKKESKSTPCRIVFNSSAKFKGQSLNDCYVKGPSMLSDLLGLLLRFCQEEVAIVGDISKMYHSIDITYIDQMTHRFLWICLDKTRKPEVFVMNVVNFGDRPSGSIAMAALRKTAKMSVREFPEASKAIQDNSYMDDILVSVGDEQKAMIRSKYWIINLPRLAKKICSSCVFCKVKRMCLHGQIMSSLPVERLQPSPPFYFVGVDYFGPYDIKGEVNKRCRGKCYGVIFTCFTTRAIHLELSVEYSTDAFIQTLRRFVCIRGWPRQFTSNNGTQLTAASKELSDVIVGLDHKKIGKNALVGGSEWKYCPANAPWMNGATESLVKSVKGALHATIGSQVLAFSEFQTVMYEAAQIVNQRPIGRNPTGPDDGTYLCPNDLLLGRATPHVPRGPFKERSSMKYGLDFIERLTEQFWIKWSRDLFPSLVIQQKWHVEKRDVKINDVVMIQRRKRRHRNQVYYCRKSSP